ncbi:MAG: gas vesicle protein GvpG [Isosphaeraceae bacterium]|nr:gas vesicle protein GvpG [Isosphaeraceae bacterium]
MIIVDDVLLFPVKSLFFLLREIHKAALQEMVDEAESIRQELSRLYLELEAGRITEDDFDDREHSLLDRLDALEADDALRDGDSEDDSEDDEDEEEDVEDPEIDEDE